MKRKCHSVDEIRRGENLERIFSPQKLSVAFN